MTKKQQSKLSLRMADQPLHRHMLEDSASYYYLAVRNPWVRTATERLAMEATSDDFSIHSSNDDDARCQTLKDALRIFLDNINDDQDFGDMQADIFRDLAIYGNWYGHKQRNKSGAICAIYPISPLLIAPIEADTLGRPELSGYIYYPKGWDTTTGEFIPKSDVIHIPLNRLGPMGTGLSLIESLEITLLLSEYAIKHQRGFFANGVNAGDIYSFDINMSQPDIEREREFLMTHTSVEESFAPLLVQGITKVKEGRSGRNDMEFGALLDRCREEICSVFGLPLSLLSTAVMGALGAVGKEQDYILFRSQVVSYMQGIVFRQFNRQLLLREFGVRDVWLMPPMSSKVRPDMAESATKILQAGGTMNEARRLMGYPEIEGCDEPIMNFRGAAVIGVPLDEQSAVITPTGTIKGIMNVTGVAEAGIKPHVRQLPTDAEQNENPSLRGPKKTTYEGQWANGQAKQAKNYAANSPTRSQASPSAVLKPTRPTTVRPASLPTKAKKHKV